MPRLGHARGAQLISQGYPQLPNRLKSMRGNNMQREIDMGIEVAVYGHHLGMVCRRGGTTKSL